MEEQNQNPGCLGYAPWIAKMIGMVLMIISMLCLFIDVEVAGGLAVIGTMFLVIPSILSQIM